MGRRYRNPTYVRDKECPHCHTFFTPQGLSGHLRFAHKSPLEDSIAAADRPLQDFADRKARLQAFAVEPGAPAEQIKEARQWLDDWYRLVFKGTALRVEFTAADFKEYIRARFMKSLGL